MSSTNELEKELEDARQKLQSDIETLSDYLKPSRTVKRIKARALNKTAEISNKATSIFERVLTGDLESLKLFTAAGIAIFGILILLRKIFK